ncbi:hypothetical protein [Flavobacterium luteolum]|uniref:hypothetical protein n=1 Tax=Flavobacterium luteolum TaxID=3003259 RepID=UPI00248E989D|nr:hypothetical protein [Flavobacterium luteolum]
MKKILLILILSSGFCTAQNQSDYKNDDFKNYSSSIFNSEEKALSVVTGMNTKAQDNLKSKIQTGIQIQQIGDLNKVHANLKSNETKVAVTQNGDYNTLLLDKNAKTITQNVVQQGNNNRITDYTLYTKYNVNMEMIQNGDNQNIQNIGTNSLSKNMKITQTGNGASIILINK